MSDLLSLYLHIPFCQRRCGYCDFVTYAGMEAFQASYVQALCKEIALTGEHIWADAAIHTIYLGGGTPSLLTSLQIGNILESIHLAFPVIPEAEISIEANPGTLDREKLEGYFAHGVNRISLGVQSARKDELQLLERIHTYEQVIRSIEMAKSCGFSNISIDLIYGLPGQRMQDWRETLNAVLQLGVQHISCYSLTIEEGTSLAGRVAAGEITPLDNDLVGEMFEEAVQFLDKAGFEHYEISNWALGTGKWRSRHNTQYWKNDDYLGLGAGAHGYYGGLRVANTTQIPDYIQRMRSGGISEAANWISPAVADVTSISNHERMQDDMMLGFRLLKDGVRVDRFREKFGAEPGEVFQDILHKLLDYGLVEYKNDPARYLLTRRGMMIANQVFLEFVGD